MCRWNIILPRYIVGESKPTLGRAMLMLRYLSYYVFVVLVSLKQFLVVILLLSSSSFSNRDLAFHAEPRSFRDVESFCTALVIISSASFLGKIFGLAFPARVGDTVYKILCPHNRGVWPWC